MLQRDYILRLIEQFARAVASVIRLRAMGEPKAAQIELQKLTQAHLGLDPKLLTTLSDAELLSLFTLGGKLDSGRTVVAQQILVEEAAIQDALGEPALGETYRLRGLSLLVDVLTRDPIMRTADYMADLSRLLESVANDIPPAIRLKLFRYYDAIGEYAEAEDHLFELVELGVADAVPEGLAFYEKLLALPDAQLAEGDLPRAEVEESLSLLKKMAET